MAFSFLIFNFWKTGKIEAAPELKDVFGWAWSENIGWIKFDGKIPFLGDTTGLKARYPLDENGGADFNDASGNGNNGKLDDGVCPGSNSCPSWTTGQYNSALKFDGVDDYARVPRPGDPPPPSLNLQNAISIEAWVKGQAAGFTKTQRTSTASGKYRPQFQVVGDKIYYVWEENHVIWTGEMNIDGTGWLAQPRTTPAGKSGWPLYLQLQVVGDKIYYVWMNVTADNKFQLWKGKLDLATNTWSNPVKIKESIYWVGIMEPQLQVVGDKIYYVWWGNNGFTQYMLYTGEMTIDINDTSWIFLVEHGCFIDNHSPQFQVVGNTIYYVDTGYDYICTGVMNTDGTGSSFMSQEISSTSPYEDPQLQVVGNKIYYVSFHKDAAGYYQIWTAEMNTDGSGWTANRRTSTATSKYNPQLQVVGDKIYYVWQEGGKIMTAESDLGSVSPLSPVNRGSGDLPQFQVVGSKSYYVWLDSVWIPGVGWRDQIFTGEMNSNLINKGDFYGLGVKDGKIIGFINAGVDGFKYKGEAISDTAGATVSLDLPDSTNWHHLVMTYDKINLKLYLDGGSLVAGGQEISVPYNATINTNLFPLIIGDDFNGAIDEIRIYNKALTADEVKAHFEGEKYGVKVEDDPSSTTYGYLSGYAWSEHIGWISFADFDGDGDVDAADKIIAGSPCTPNCEAKLDLTATGTVCGGAGWVCGWARALVDGGGWDGWIKLGPIIFDSTNHGVWLDTSITPTHEFRGWAWGSDVIGWISFNCKEGGYNEGTGQIYNICSTLSNYQVKTSLFLNFKPTASNLSLSSKYCDVNPGVGQVSFSWLYEDQEKSPQSHYRLEIAVKDFNDPSFNPSTDVVVNCEIPHTVASGSYDSRDVQVISNAPVENCTLPLQISYRGEANPYYWRISVKDGLQWSDPAEGTSFTTPSHAKPWVDFTWCPLTDIKEHDDIQFCSTEETGVCESGAVCESGPTRTLPDPTTVPPTTCYDAFGNEVSCTSWTWDFRDAIILVPPPPNAQVEYGSKGERTVTLTVCDADYCCSISRDVRVEVELSLPQWKEIPPTF